MKIYFNVSARALPKYFKEYSRIEKLITNLDHQNLNPLSSIENAPTIYAKSDTQIGNLYEAAIKRIQNANIVILEVSIPSLTQGYLIYRALDIGVPVIALHLPGTPQAFTRGIKHEKFQLIEYTLDTVKTELEQAIEQAKAVMDIRFNFFISPKINAYLDALAEEKKDSKSNLLRHIIQEHMHNHPES